MVDEMNGASPPPMPSKEQMEKMIDQAVGPIVATMLNGIKVTIQGANPDAVLIGACRVMGRIMGAQFGVSDNLGLLLSRRKECLEEFAKGMKSITPRMQPQQGAVVMPALPGQA